MVLRRSLAFSSVVLVAVLLSTSFAVELYKHANCTGPCDSDSGACPTATCVYTFGSCKTYPGYVEMSMVMSPDDKDCMDNGCTSDDCPEGFQRVGTEMCVSTHCKTLFCYQESCCKLRVNVTCCAQEACDKHYQDCQIAQQKSLTDTSVSQVYSTKVAHTGSVTFPFYTSAQATEQGSMCEHFRSWGKCVCEDGQLMPDGCLSEASETWYDLSSETNATLPPNLPDKCLQFGDSWHSSSDGQQASGTSDSGGTVDHGVTPSSSSTGDSTAVVAIVGVAVGGVCALLLLAIAVWKVTQAVSAKLSCARMSNNYHQLRVGKSPGSSFGGMREAFSGFGIRKKGSSARLDEGDSGRGTLNALPAVPEEDEVFTLEDLNDSELGLLHHSKQDMKRLKEMELLHMQGKALSPTAGEKQSLLSVSHTDADSIAHISDYAFGGMRVNDDDDDDDALLSTPPNEGKDRRRFDKNSE